MNVDHFSQQSEEYVRYRPRYPAELFDWLTTLVPACRRAWDCACGSGQATGELAKRFESVVATDLSSAQIEKSPRIRNVEWRVAIAEASGLPTASMDLVTVAQAVHWFHLTRFWREAQRIIRPRGVIAVWCYGIFEFDDPRIAAVCQHYYADVLADYWPAERRIVEVGYGKLPFPFDEILAPPFRLEVEWNLPSLLGYLASWSATVRYRQALGKDPLKMVENQLQRIWSTPTVSVRWPLSVRVGRKL